MDFDRETIFKQVLQSLSNKPRYNVFDEEVIGSVFEEVVSKNEILFNKVMQAKNLERSKYFKQFLSLIKTKLYKKSAMYFRGETHLSITERQMFPQTVVDFLKEHNVRKVLDLGCGLTPLIFPFDEINIESYLAFDLNKQVVERVNLFFKEKKYNGVAEQKDFMKYLDDLPETDVVFLFKVLDLIEDKGHKLAETIVKKLKAKYLIVSFPLRTLSGKPMRFTRRTWLEKMLARLGLEFYYKKEKNEIFYFVFKS